MKLKKTKKGFTLIELIVVVVVLAILAAVAVPMISSWVVKAEQGETAANGRTVELAVKAYMAANALNSIDANQMSAALTEFGLANPIAKSKGSYTVSSKGAVTVTYPATGTAGGITFN